MPHILQSVDPEGLNSNDWPRKALKTVYPFSYIFTVMYYFVSAYVKSHANAFNLVVNQQCIMASQKSAALPLQPSSVETQRVVKDDARRSFIFLSH